MIATHLSNHWLSEARSIGFINNIALRVLLRLGIPVEMKHIKGSGDNNMTVPVAPVGDKSKRLYAICCANGRKMRYKYQEERGYLTHGVYTDYIQAHMLEAMLPMVSKHQVALFVYDCLEADKNIWDKRGRDNYFKLGEVALRKDRLFHEWKFELLERLGEYTDVYDFFRKLYAQQ